MKVVHTTHGDFRVWASDQVGAHLAAGGFWDWPLQPTMDRVAATDRARTAWALDLGAAFGWFTCYLAQRFAHVLAVEAYPETYHKLLVPNIEAHRLAGNVTACCYIAYDHPGYFVLASAAMHGWPLHALDEQPNASSFAFVPISAGVDLDPFKWVAGGPIDHFVPEDVDVALIKCDVQGCDLRALRGLRQTIRRCRPTILFEYEMGPSLWHGDEWADYTNWLGAEGYSVTELPGSNYLAEPLAQP